MAEVKKARWKVVIPAGATLKAGTSVVGGQSGGPPPGGKGTVITIGDEDIVNASEDMDMTFEYEWPYYEEDD